MAPTCKSSSSLSAPIKGEVLEWELEVPNLYTGLKLGSVERLFNFSISTILTWALSSTYFDGDWHDWISLGGDFWGEPAIVRIGEQLHIFGISQFRERKLLVSLPLTFVPDIFPFSIPSPRLSRSLRLA